ncbi:DUF6457 domain-containing protein [Streptomyces sp. NBC_00841]|uniref:DUF6457 domain-containing protein n=1 Tax=unclassified Streptomyces TaxID=2593676 RepID=UPI00224DEAF0|nr:MULTISPECIES: DUF6457 domain-containing protein [unclassified Streptomyces]MCX4537151.1 DUF6457 domain-containing protein [Streptomyces sp. NBC_01669]WRZ97614.1 DUF6457 domain-containing protein [Streptomyces sp. NBC_00841]
MRQWIAAAEAEPGVDLDVDMAGLLDMTKVDAHGVRPAAPLTAFPVGCAAARAGGGPEAVAAANHRVAAPAERWAAERESDSGTA